MTNKKGADIRAFFVGPWCPPGYTCFPVPKAYGFLMWRKRTASHLHFFLVPCRALSKIGAPEAVSACKCGLFWP